VVRIRYGIPVLEEPEFSLRFVTVNTVYIIITIIIIIIYLQNKLFLTKV
jgi:hypothetical protein